MDAEERKAELMAQNKMSDGRMFKLDFDPRVIGNKDPPGRLSRRPESVTSSARPSLDEFPQFWNVLNGDHESGRNTAHLLVDELPAVRTPPQGQNRHQARHHRHVAGKRSKRYYGL